LLSKAALESPWIIYEISASVASAETGSGKRVIPVALGKDISPSGILAQYQWINTSGDPEEVVQRVIQALKTPYEHDKARDRENALRNLTQAEQAHALDQLTWSLARNNRNASLANWLLLVALFILVLVAAVGIIVAIHGNSGTLAPVIGGVLGALIASSLSYIIGRFRSGVPNGRSDK